jgi:hypothetical protein
MITYKSVAQKIQRRWNAVEIRAGHRLFLRATGLNDEIIEWLDAAVGNKRYLVYIRGWSATFYFASKEDAATFKICWFFD